MIKIEKESFAWVLWTEIFPRLLISLIVAGFTFYVIVFEVGGEGVKMALMGVFGATVQHWLGTSLSSSVKGRQNEEEEDLRRAITK